MLDGAGYWSCAAALPPFLKPCRPGCASRRQARPCCHSGRHVIEEQLWPLCSEKGANMLWLPARSPWYVLAPLPGASGAWFARCLQSHLALRAWLRFNPIEKFNGWLKDRVAENIEKGHASNADLQSAVYSTLEREKGTLPAKCRGWIDFLFGTPQ